MCPINQVAPDGGFSPRLTGLRLLASSTQNRPEDFGYTPHSGKKLNAITMPNDEMNIKYLINMGIAVYLTDDEKPHEMRVLALYRRNVTIFVS